MSNIIEVTNDGKIIEILAGGVITVNGGGGGGGATNLAYTASPTNGIVTSDTGTDATIPLVLTDAGLMSPSDKTKLDGVQAGATANATDAQLRDRATHTGTQAISTVSGLQTALDGKQATGDYATNTALTSGLALKANVSHSHVIADVTNLQTTLDGKEPTITAGTSAQYYRGDKTFQTLDKTAVGLANVVNADTTTTANITDSSNKRFITDAQQTVLGNTSGTNTGDNATNTTSNTYADGKVADAITDGVTTIAPSQNAVFDALAGKQATLVSGTNIKTINGDSILGSGNLVVTGAGGISNAQSIVNALIFG